MPPERTLDPQLLYKGWVKRFWPLILVLIALSIVTAFYLYRQTQTDQRLAEFENLCDQTPVISDGIEIKATGPIWISNTTVGETYAGGVSDTAIHASLLSNARLYLGRNSIATHPLKANILLCVIRTYEETYTCEYGVGMIKIPVVTQIFTALLIDLDTAEIIGQAEFEGDSVGCPDSIDLFSSPKAFVSKAFRPEPISVWLAENWIRE